MEVSTVGGTLSGPFSVLAILYVTKRGKRAGKCFDIIYKIRVHGLVSVDVVVLR